MDYQERPGKRPHNDPEQATAAVTVIGVGASAGGLKAFRLLLSTLPADTGFAIVLVQHLDPSHQSSLSEILSRATRMPVQEAREGMPVQANHVYVIPPNASMTIHQRVLHLSPRNPTA